jgi:hypothetical protein
MSQSSNDLKKRKLLRSIDLHPDLKPEAVKRLLNELNADAAKHARTQVLKVVILL